MSISSFSEDTMPTLTTDTTLILDTLLLDQKIILKADKPLNIFDERLRILDENSPMD